MAILNLGNIMYELSIKKDGWNKGFEGANKDIQGHESKWKSFAGNIGGKVKTAVVGSTIAIGAAVGAMAVKGVKNMIELDDHMAKFRSSTGVTAEEANKVRDVVKELYKVNEDSYEDIVKTSEALKKYFNMSADDMKKYQQDFQNYAKVTGQVNDEAVEKVGKLADAWQLNTDDTVKLMDKLKYSNEEYGTSIEGMQSSLQTLAPSFKALGMNVDEGIGYMNMFKMAGVDTGVATTAFNKALTKVKSPKELKKLIKDIGDTRDPFKRAAKASEVFGAKAGPQLAHALGEADLDIDKFVKGIGESEGAVNKASDAYDASLKVQLNLLKKQLEGLFTDLGEKLAPLVKGFVAWLQENGPAIGEVLTAIFEVAGEVIGGIVDFIKQVIKVFKEWFDSTSKDGDGIKGIFKTISDTIKSSMNTIKTIINDVLEIVKILWEKYGNNIKGIVSGVFGNIKSSIKMTMEVIKNIIKVILAVLKGDWKGAWEGMKGIVSAILTGIISTVKGSMKIIVNVVLGIGKALFNAGKTIFTFLWNGIKSVWEGIYNWVGEKVKWLANKLTFWKSSKSEMNNGADGKHFSGLKYVPFDGYRAILHKGEAVVKANENPYNPNARSPLGAGEGGGISLNIENFVNNRKQDIRELAEELEFYKKQSNIATGGV
ncbi:phage tail tape measure protein [Hathewaya histolytica]|uniref:phage tail tape measure protein n=1 Tax=Hathewaya histolytica TaxID=1498 RepID=UPI003B6836BC